ncbi:MAG: hypothetical protein ACI8VC_000705 [Candidatus Endobugula sp.]
MAGYCRIKFYAERAFYAYAIRTNYMLEENGMKKNIFLSMLGITKVMCDMATNDQWDLLAEKETERQELIAQLKSMISQEGQEDQKIIIEIVKEMNRLNQQINTLANERNTVYKTSLIQLQKSKKINDLYLGQ